MTKKLLQSLLIPEMHNVYIVLVREIFIKHLPKLKAAY
jgi:hypothetical protein